MQKPDITFLLHESIRQKEAERDEEKALLTYQFKLTMQSLKPMNLLKSAFTSSEVRNSVVDTAIGMGSGFIVRKAIVRSSKNPLLKLLGSVVGMGVANLMAKHPGGIKSVGGKILNSLFKKEEGDSGDI